MTTPSPTPSSSPATTRRPVRWPALLAAAAVVLALLLALPSATIWLAVALDPTRYEGLGGVVVLLWWQGTFLATGVGLLRLADLWWRLPHVREYPVETALRACIPGASVLGAVLVLTLVLGGL